MELKPTTCQLCGQRPQTSETCFCYVCNPLWLGSIERKHFFSKCEPDDETAYMQCVSMFRLRMLVPGPVIPVGPNSDLLSDDVLKALGVEIDQ